MNIEQLESLLVERLDATEEEGEYRIPKDNEVTALLKTGADLLHVNRVRRLETGQAGTVTLITDTSEYFVEADEIFALKLEGSRLQEGDSRPGFRRD